MFTALVGLHKITFYWVKGHSGILGNEIAGSFANSARHCGILCSQPQSFAHVKKCLVKQVVSLWNSYWQSERSSKHIFTWIPNLILLPDYFPPSYFLTQLLTGHGRFPFCFMRFGISRDDTCTCGRPIQSIAHYLTECTMTRSLVDQITQHLHLGPPFPYQRSIQNPVTAEFLDRVVQLINDETPTY